MVLRTLRSIARASGRVSMVIMILLMLVDSERKLFVAQFLHLTRENDVRSTQEIQLVLVHGDGVQSARQKIFEFCHLDFLRLDSFLMLDESLQRFYDAVLWCAHVSFSVRGFRCDVLRRSRKECRTPLEGLAPTEADQTAIR